MARTIPCVLMRAGTSRGPFFLRERLPAEERERDEALIGAIGASDRLQVDGVGGGSSLTSKVAIASKSREPGCDVDYLFAQVGVGQKSVDTRPNCDNMLSGVAPFAIEQGLVEARDGETTVRVFNGNTPSRIDAAGMILRALDLGLSGRETPDELDGNREVLAKIESIRLAAGQAMGQGDVSQSVAPKPVIASHGDDDDSITPRYLTPRRCRASHAVTEAIGVATAFPLPDRSCRANRACPTACSQNQVLETMP